MQTHKKVSNSFFWKIINSEMTSLLCIILAHSTDINFNSNNKFFFFCIQVIFIGLPILSSSWQLNWIFTSLIVCIIGIRGLPYQLCNNFNILQWICVSHRNCLNDVVVYVNCTFFIQLPITARYSLI